MEIEQEVEVSYPEELFAFLQKKIDTATYTTRKIPFEEVKAFISDRRFRTTVYVEVEPEEADWRD